MTAPSPPPVQVGVDLGGTGTRSVAVVGGTVAGSSGRLTAQLGAGSVAQRMDRLADLVRSVVPANAGLAAVGVGASGPVDISTGRIHNPGTLPWFSGFPFVRELERRLGVPVTIDNDAVTAALGEHAAGAGQGCARMLMITLGTGVGCAMLIGGRPVRGADGAHPEGGHIPVTGDPERCYCGLTGCWEQAASRTTLQRMLRAVLGAGPADPLLLSEAHTRAATEPAVQDVFTAYGRAVGRGLAALHTLHQPTVTVLGGSAATCLPLFADGVREALHRSPDFDVRVEIRAAALGDNAGAVGAAVGLTNEG